MSWKGFREEARTAPKSELAEIQRQIDEIRIEQERLKLERERLLLGETAGRASAPAAAPVAPPLPATPAPVADAPPAALPPPPADPPAAASSGVDGDARARAIAAAPVVATITEWVDDPQIGSFATLSVRVAPSVQNGTVLCVRRNSGILGRLKVGEVSAEGAIANAVSQFGAVKPAAGDELILEPAGP
jgi:biotin carboxyl carrier protein